MTTILSNKKGFWALLLFGFYLLTNVSCKHELGLVKVLPNDTSTHYTPSNTNLIDSICYEEMVQPILLSGCSKTGCHDNVNKQAGINFSSYENMKATISGDLLMQSIHETGVLKMPPSPNPPLNSNQINTIQQWVKEGMKKGIDCEGECDTLNITYSKSILPIIQNNCLGCHTTGDFLMTSYDKIATMVNNGKLTCTINQKNGCKPMPPTGPKLSSCKLLLIKKWIDAGAPNN